MDARTITWISLSVKSCPPLFKTGWQSFAMSFASKACSIGQSRRLLTAAREMGLALKLHADEIVPLGGVGQLRELSAVSADHLLHASDADIRAMADKGVVATLLPLPPLP